MSITLWSNPNAVKLASHVASSIRDMYGIPKLEADMNEALASIGPAEEAYQAAKASMEIAQRTYTEANKAVAQAMRDIKSDLVQAAPKKLTEAELDAQATIAARTDPRHVGTLTQAGHAADMLNEAQIALGSAKAMVNNMRTRVGLLIAKANLATARINVFAGLDQNPPPASIALAGQAAQQ